MKRIIALIVAALLALSMCSVLAEDADFEPTVMFVTGCGSLKLLCEADYNSDQLGFIACNMPVTVLEIEKSSKYNFAYVICEISGIECEGYVNADYLTTQEPKSMDIEAYVGTMDGLWLRTANYVKAPAIVLMPVLTQVTINYYCGNWANVTAVVEDVEYTGFCYRKPVNWLVFELSEIDEFIPYFEHRYGLK